MIGRWRGVVAGVAVLVALLVVAISLSQNLLAQDAKGGGARERLIGAWHLVRIDSGEAGGNAAGPQPDGMLVYSRDGHVSVQLMYPAAASGVSNEYVLAGYEASFGSFEMDEAAHTVTHHVLGSNTRELLVGKDLPRKFEFTADGHLVIRSARADEHWFVTWAHY